MRSRSSTPIAGIAAVAGPTLTPPDDSELERLGGRVYASPLVSGPARWRYAMLEAADVDDAPSVNLIVRRSEAEAVGLDSERPLGRGHAALRGAAAARRPDPLRPGGDRLPLAAPALAAAPAPALSLVAPSQRLRAHGRRQLAAGPRTSLPRRCVAFLLSRLLVRGPLRAAAAPWVRVRLYALACLIAGADRSPSRWSRLSGGIAATHVVYGLGFLPVCSGARPVRADGPRCPRAPRRRLRSQCLSWRRSSRHPADRPAGAGARPPVSSRGSSSSCSSAASTSSSATGSSSTSTSSTSTRSRAWPTPTSSGTTIRRSSPRSASSGRPVQTLIYLPFVLIKPVATSLAALPALLGDVHGGDDGDDHPRAARLGDALVRALAAADRLRTQPDDRLLRRQRDGRGGLPVLPHLRRLLPDPLAADPPQPPARLRRLRHRARDAEPVRDRALRGRGRRRDRARDPDHLGPQRARRARSSRGSSSTWRRSSTSAWPGCSSTG